jgi:hypothetical protein
VNHGSGNASIRAAISSRHSMNAPGVLWWLSVKPRVTLVSGRSGPVTSARV